MGGLLLHTTRNTVTKDCHSKFDKFLTSCTYNTTLYDEATGEVVILPTTTGGLRPYGVDAVFLEGSRVRDSSLAVGECLEMRTYPERSKHSFMQAWTALPTYPSRKHDFGGCDGHQTSHLAPRPCLRWVVAVDAP